MAKIDFGYIIEKYTLMTRLYRRDHPDTYFGYLTFDQFEVLLMGTCVTKIDILRPVCGGFLKKFCSEYI